MAAIVGPWDRNPVLERLEANRVAHLVAAYIRDRELAEERQRRAGLEELLYAIEGSSAFGLAERLGPLAGARQADLLARTGAREALGK